MAVTDFAMSRVAAAIAEPARARMLCALMDGHARTSTELAVIAGVGPRRPAPTSRDSPRWPCCGGMSRGGIVTMRWRG